jgi:hypothetical protein
MHNCTQLGIQLLPSFQDFCFFVSAFTVHSPPDKDNEQVDQGQQCGAPEPIPDLGQEWWVFEEDAPAMVIVVDKVFKVVHWSCPHVFIWPQGSA